MKLNETFETTDKPASFIKIQWQIIADPLHTFKRAFRGLEKEVSIKIYHSVSPSETVVSIPLLKFQRQEDSPLP